MWKSATAWDEVRLNPWCYQRLSRLFGGGARWVALCRYWLVLGIIVRQQMGVYSSQHSGHLEEAGCAPWA